MSETVHTSITLALITAVAMAVIGLLISRWSLEIMGTPDDVIAQATLYMKIYFLGMPFFMLYNYGAAILRAVGDTKRPLFYLIISGVINAILTTLHLPNVQWLGDPNQALRTICMMEIWQFGSSMVMFLAALKNVPADLYEAAEIDGASKVKMFFSITVPQITPIIFFNLIMQTIQALQNFTSAFVITDGGPMKATYVLGMKLYKEGFSYFKMGYASAISWIIFIVIMLITLVLFATSKWWVFYGDES